MTSKSIKVRVKTQPVVIMEAEVARKIRQHARTSLKTEVCGVLLGSAEQDRTLIEACVAGINAAQGGAHVTFTQDTWAHIYKIKDKQYPDSKIVGWYHSHPGFGVFLSEHDLFIQENFFSSPHQVAWVYDPHTDEEGCFGWVGGATEKLSSVRFGYSQSVEVGAPTPSEDGEEEEDGDGKAGLQIRVRSADTDREPPWMKWTSRTLMYIAVLGLGFILGHMFLQWRLGPALEVCQQIAQDPWRACQAMLQQSGTAPQAPAFSGMPQAQNPSPNPNPNQQSPVQPQKPRAGKDNDGKH